MTHEAASVVLPLSLTSSSGSGFEQQIAEQFPVLIERGTIAPGTLLPPARELASELLVSPATVRRAYDRLETEGLVARRWDDRRFVARDATAVLRDRTLDRSRSELARAVADLRRVAPVGRENLETEAEHLRRAVELDQAREMQRSLLPAGPPAVPGLDVAVAMSTASEVGGDYYDFFSRPGGGLRAVIGDATGHGLAAGIMAAMAKACLTAITAETPAAMMKRANDVLRTARGRRVMMALAVLDVAGDHAVMCSAGMPPVLVVRAATRVPEEIALPSLPLGCALAASFPCRRAELAPGDTIVAYSDGLTELRNPRGEALGAPPIRACLREHADATAAEVVAALTGLAAAWRQDRAIEDDITVLAIKRSGEWAS